jgi:histidinol-phosphate aminotransferase
MKLVPYNNTILEISPYVPGAYAKSKTGKLIKLSSNENPFGCSPKVTELLQNGTILLNRYPEGTSKQLREELGKLNNINPEQIVCGAGSDELITLIVMAYAGQGAEVIYTKHGFLMYPITALSLGAKPVVADEVNLKANVDNIIAKITDKTRIIFIANPNNPTGSYLNDFEIRELIAKTPKNILIVLDYAYAEFVEEKDYPDAIKLANQFENVVMMRTFSKTYGIPALRLGWAYANSEIIDIINRVRGPFNVSSIAQLCGIAALQDQDFIKKTVQHNNSELKRLNKEFLNLSYKPYSSVANFILVDFGTEEKANAIDLKLQQQGISVRKMNAYHLPSCIRFSIGLEEENNAMLEALNH